MDWIGKGKKSHQLKSSAAMKAQELELSSQIYLENIIERIPYFIFWKNTASVYLGCNQRFATLVGKSSPKEVIGKTDFDLNWGAGEPEFFIQGDQEVMQGSPRVNIEEVLIRPDGSQIVMLVNKLPLRDHHGHCIGILGTSTDITEIKNTQEKLKKAEGRLDGMLLLSASIAHELRTPLTSIRAGVKGLVDLLPRLFDAYRQAKKYGLEVKPISEKVLNISQGSLERIDNSAKKAHQTIDMILMSISADENNLKRNDLCSIKQCIEAGITEYSFQPGKAGLVHLQGIEDFHFYGSEMLIKHIIFNLLRNALYFIEKVGKGEIFIETSQEGNFNKLHFKDTGQGIPPEILPKIFDRFFTEGTHQGTGVGLSFCKMVMVSLGGKIECYSQLGEYTEFVLYFPGIAS
jgi:PAS domain S-box-containing protein